MATAAAQKRRQIALARELHRPVVKKFTTRRIFVKSIDHIWAADLLVMTRFSKENRDFKYILNVIDCFSKYVWSVALKKKTGKEVTEKFEQILRQAGGRRPKLLHTDMGKEFVCGTFQKMLGRYGIQLYHSYSEVKSSIVERFNRTLNEKMKIHFEVNQNRKWFWILKGVVKEYNEKCVHRTIGCTPAQVTKKNEAEIFARLYPLNKFTLDRPTFRVGERVRLTRKQKLFGNKYLRNWTTEIFQINDVHYTNPITYSIRALDGEEILGKFYKQELQRTNF
jgi:transposase InsO family protein